MRNLFLSLLAMLLWQQALCAQSFDVYDTDVFVTAMSRNGNWLSGVQGPPAETSQFLWSPSGGFTELNLDQVADPEFELPGFVLGISNDTSIFAGHGESPLSRDSDTEAFRWTSEPGWNTLTTSDSEFERMSADGHAIVGNFYRDNDPVDSENHGFVWSANAGFTQIPNVTVAGSDRSPRSTVDISADGQVVVGTSSGTIVDDSGTQRFIREAYRWSADDGTTVLGMLQADHVNSRGMAISPDGNYIGGNSDSGSESIPFIWTESDGMTELPSSVPDVQVESISRDGRIILGSVDAQTFVWDEARNFYELEDYFEQQTGLDFSTWTLSDPCCDQFFSVHMSDDGLVFAGNGARGITLRSWRLSLVPEPGTGCTGLAAVAILLLFVRSQRRTS